MQKNKQKAFTLLEILVVISIIGILVTLGTAAFSTAQKRGRDARRQADIKAIQNGFEQYYAKNTVYPATVALASDVTIFPSGLPDDPRNSDGNVYTFNMSASGFCVCALLESGSGNASALPASGATACTYGNGNYYCLSNLQ